MNKWGGKLRVTNARSKLRESADFARGGKGAGCGERAGAPGGANVRVVEIPQVSVQKKRSLACPNETRSLQQTTKGGRNGETTASLRSAASKSSDGVYTVGSEKDF
eukprot:gene5039-biopygen19138